MLRSLETTNDWLRVGRWKEKGIRKHSAEPGVAHSEAGRGQGSGRRLLPSRRGGPGAGGGRLPPPRGSVPSSRTPFSCGDADN